MGYNQNEIRGIKAIIVHYYYYYYYWNPDSAVGIATGYGLDDRGVGF
jgi:hypothetical protein